MLSSNRKYQPYPISYVSVFVCLRCLLHHILSLIAYTFRENRDFVFIIIVQFMMSANIRKRFGLQIVFVCSYITPSHYHHCANLSGLFVRVTIAIVNNWTKAIQIIGSWFATCTTKAGIRSHISLNTCCSDLCPECFSIHSLWQTTMPWSTETLMKSCLTNIVF